MKMYSSVITSIEEVAQNAQGKPETKISFNPIQFKSGKKKDFSFDKKPEDLIQDAIIYFSEDDNDIIKYNGSFEKTRLRIYEKSFKTLIDKNIIAATFQTVINREIIIKKSFYGFYNQENLLDKYSYDSLEMNVLENDFTILKQSIHGLEDAVKTHTKKLLYDYKNDLVYQDSISGKFHNFMDDKENPWNEIHCVSSDLNTMPKYIADFYKYLSEEIGIENLRQYLK